MIYVRGTKLGVGKCKNYYYIISTDAYPFLFINKGDKQNITEKADNKIKRKSMNRLSLYRHIHM
jgi:hypothetical protein